RMDFVSYYENGVLVRQEAQTTCQGKQDVWISYEDGQKVRQEEDLDCDGSVDVRYVFENGKLARKEILGGPAASSVPQPPAPVRIRED
ncbi:MAG: hypothetical protein ACE5FK_07170, partial [Candidatus Methylomirabilia bacterium]